MVGLLNGFLGEGQGEWHPAAVGSVAGPPNRRTDVRTPRDFGKALAIGAPDPILEIPFKPSRMIHFLDFSNEKMVAKAPDIAPTVDILLGNLEDAVPVDRKVAARAGL